MLAITSWRAVCPREVALSDFLTMSHGKKYIFHHHSEHTNIRVIVVYVDVCVCIYMWVCVYMDIHMYISLDTSYPYPSNAVIFSILFYFIFENAGCSPVKCFHDSLLGLCTWQFEKHWPNGKHTDFDVKKQKIQISPLPPIGKFFCLFAFKKNLTFSFLICKTKTFLWPSYQYIFYGTGLGTQ